MSAAQSILHDFQKRLAEARSRTLSAEAQRGLFVFGSIALGWLIILVLLEAVFQLNSAVRTMLFGLGLAGLLGPFVGFALGPLLRLLHILPSDNDIQLAGKLGPFFPEVRDRLINLLQLHEDASKGTTLYSAELIDASFHDLSDAAKNVNFIEAVDFSDSKRWRTRFLVVVATSALTALIMPSTIEGSLYRLLHFGREFVPPPEYVFEISPGNTEIVKGDNVPVEVRVRAVGALKQSPKELRLFSRLEGQTSFDHAVLRPETSGVFKTTFTGVRGSTLYFAQVEDVQSEWYELKVVDRPIVRTFQIRLDYPGYTNLPPRIQDEFVGDVSALPGTRVTLKGAASKELQSASLEFGNGKKIPLALSGERFSAVFPLSSETSYFIHLTDRERLTNLDPVKYLLKIIPDESPTVTVVEPGRNLDIAGSQSLSLVLQGQDDFGFTKLRLGYRLIHSRYERPSEDYDFISIPLAAKVETQFETHFLWNLSKLSLVPEDVVEYFAEVFDNDIVRGPKSGRSKTFLIRLPSLEEVFTDVNKGHEQTLDELKHTLEDAKRLKDDIEAINNDLKKNKELDWQKQKKLEDMAKKYQEIQKKLENVKSRVEQMVQKMDQQNVLSRETMEKYFELQQLLEQLNSAELQKVLKQMQQAMQNVDKERLREALQQMTFSEERFRQSIERTLNLLKRLQIEQKLDEVKKRTEELAETEKQLQEMTKEAVQDPHEQEEIAKQQEDLAKKEAAMERAAQDLEQKMQEFFAEMPVDKLQQLNRQIVQQKLAQQMMNAATQLRQGQVQQAQQAQQQVQQQLQQFGEQFDALQREMLQQNAQYVMNELRRAVNNLLELSKRQEELKQNSQSAPSNSPQLRQNAQDQMRVMQDLGSVIQGLSEVSQRSFAITPEMGQSIGEAMGRMQNAMRNLDIRSGGSASNEQTAAMSALNKASMQLQSALQAMMQGGQGGGMGSLLGQLQAMAGQQMSINQQTLSMQQAAEAARLAVEQEALRKSVEELNHEAQASGEQKKLLGDLSKIAEEMKEVVRNLEQSNVNPETIQKQERILSRLLDASKSMRERDFEKRRKAETGTQISRRSPKDLDVDALEGRSRLREDLLKALEQGYSKDYRELIRRYFEELEKTEKRDLK